MLILSFEEPFTDKPTGKYLPALKCLLAAHRIDAEHPMVHEQSMSFRQTIDSLSEPLPPKAHEVLTSSFTLIPKEKSLKDVNEQYLMEHKSSAAHVQAGLRTRQALDSSTKAQNIKELQATLDLDGIAILDAVTGLRMLDGFEADAAAKNAYVEAARKRFPEATVFQK